MRGSSRYVSLLVLATLLTGLISTAGAGERGGGKVVPWGLDGCDAVIALVPINADSVEPLLPKGFTAVVPDSVRALLPPDPRLEAVFGLEALRCESGVGVRGAVDAPVYGSYWTFVQPPAHLTDEDYPLNFFKWDTLVPDPATRRFLSARGLTVVDGDAHFGSWNTSPFGIAFDATLSLDGSGSHRLRGAAGAPLEFSGRFIEFSKAHGGLAEWRTTYDSELAVGGAGIVEMETGSFPAKVVGSERAQSYFLVGTGVEFAEGSITLPR